MRFSPVVLGVLLWAAPLFSQPPAAADPRIEKGELRWFLLGETRAEITQALGQPRLVADFGEDFESRQYQIGVLDEHDFSHQLVFRKTDNQLISVTRNYEPERNVDQWFPPAETTVHFYPDANKPQYSVRLRHLSGGRILMAMGTSKAGETTGQIVLIRESELRYFHPWLFEQLDRSRRHAVSQPARQGQR